MDLAEHRGSTNWGYRKSNQYKSNQIKFWFLVRGENRSTRGKTSRLFLLPLLSLAIQLRLWRDSTVLPGITERLDPKQFAMAGKATQQAIVYPLHLTLEALDQGNCWARWFFADFKKGFDLVDHRIVLDKIKLVEVHPCLLRWIASFLEGRSQLVRIAITSSPPCRLNGGIPQGTRLGPLLFVVMVNDLIRRWLPRAKFVDDLTVIEIILRNIEENKSRSRHNVEGSFLQVYYISAGQTSLLQVQ